MEVQLISSGLVPNSSLQTSGLTPQSLGMDRVGAREEGKGDSGVRMGPVALAPVLSNPKASVQRFGGAVGALELQLCPARLQGHAFL